MNSNDSTSLDENENFRRDVLAVLNSQMQTHERYHTQKENMTWLVTAGYIGATIAFVGREPFWREWPIHWFIIWIVLLLITAIAVNYFIYWHFKNKNKASAFFTSCADIAAKCLYSPLVKKDFLPVPLRQMDGMLVPVIVKKRFKKNYRECSWSQVLTMTVSILWTIVAGIYILLMYEGQYNFVNTELLP